MPLRPIDAIFFHPKHKFYVVYLRGELWQLPRMKLDSRSWQRKRPYEGDPSELYLLREQKVQDTQLAAQLRTLNLPDNVQGCSLPKFEEWWANHGYDWLKSQIDTGQSPLTAVEATSKKDGSDEKNSDMNLNEEITIKQKEKTMDDKNPETVKKSNDNSIFDDMLAQLTEDLLKNH